MAQTQYRQAQRQAVSRSKQTGLARSQMPSHVLLRRKLRAGNSSSDSSDSSDCADESDASSESGQDSGYSSELDIKTFFTQLIAKHKETGPIMANYSDRTKAMIETGRAYFYEYVWQGIYVYGMLTASTRFCTKMDVNPVETIKACKVEFIKGYLEWRLIFSWIKKQSSIITY
jgi:hypothetical protein